MDYSSDWLLKLVHQYKIEKQKNPLFISDWDITNITARYPYEIIKNSLLLSEHSSVKYLFPDELNDLKSQLVSSIVNCNNIGIENITITPSGTASLYLTLKSLHKNGAKSFLLFTPTYYTIIDTLKDFGAKIAYYDLYDSQNFCININEIDRILVENNIDVLVFSDPIYSAGIEIPVETYELLSMVCKRRKCWLLCDYTLGGLEWANKDSSLFNNIKIDLLSKSARFIFIESLTKRLFINGIKSSIVFSSKQISHDIEDAASQVYGGFCAPQIILMRQLYDKKNSSELLSLISHNKDVILNNYSLLSTFLMGTPYTIYRCNSGYFTMIVHKEHRTCDVFSKEIISNFLFNYDLLAFPSFHFSFNSSNLFGFRVNLLTDISSLLPNLSKCIWENTKMFH